MRQSHFIQFIAIAAVMVFQAGAFCSCEAQPRTQETTPPAESPETPEGMDLTFREILEKYYTGEKLYIGCAVHNNIANPQNEESIALRKEFSYITPANDFKQTEIHPDSNDWSWEKADRWLPFAKKYRQIIRMHGPISPQCSKWAKDDARTPEELERNLREYMTELCRRYDKSSDVIKWMDVVNETITVKPTTDEAKGDGKIIYDVGDWFGPVSGARQFQMPWTLIGADAESLLKTPKYIDIAFEIANREAPHIKQIINQNGQLEEPVVEKLKEMVIYLRGKGRRVDGIGWQAHIDLGWEKVSGNIQRLSELISWCHANELEFHITEFNIWAKPGEENLLDRQADTFSKVVETVLSKRYSGPIGINFWFQRTGGTETHGIIKCAMWNKDGSPQPAYNKVKEVLLKEAAKQ